MQFSVYKMDKSATVALSEEAMKPDELAARVAELEREKRRYIVFPTNSYTASWQRALAGI
jgi:hypothetical protein